MDSQRSEIPKSDQCNSNKVHLNCVQFKGYNVPSSFLNIQKAIEDMEVYDDDIWVTSYPKCGATWTQEMVWCIANDLNFEEANKDLEFRFLFLEYACLFNKSTHKTYKPDFITKSVEFVEKADRPRFIKTHLPWELLPKQIQTFEKRPKIIHVARNPMDACVSYYHHVSHLKRFTGEFKDFWELFLNDKVSWCPFADAVLSYWHKRYEPNILFFTYEDMKQNLKEVINKVIAFTNNRTLMDNEMENLLQHLSFESMKNNSNVQHSLLIDYFNKNGSNLSEWKFIRKGVSGGYLSVMKPEEIELFNKKILAKLNGAGLHFNL